MSKKQSNRRKTFVLDTNVLLYDPQCVTKFGSNDIIIPLDVITELDRFKGEQNERGAAARAVTRMLAKLTEEGDIRKGVRLPNGAKVATVLFNPHAKYKPFQGGLADFAKADHRILAAAYSLRTPGKTIIMVTNDLNMQILSRMVGMTTEAFKGTVVPKVIKRGQLELEVTPKQMAELHKHGDCNTKDRYPQNTYAMATCGNQRLPVKFDTTNNTWETLNHPEHINIRNGATVRPKNAEQKLLTDAMFNPDIKFITVEGQAGTGKTFMAVACALAQVLDTRYETSYDKLIISRPVVEMGDGVGFLPGDLQDKLAPWMQPVYDALEILLDKKHKPQVKASHAKKKQAKQVPKKQATDRDSKVYQPLIDSGILELEALCYIRGRSIPNSIFLLDEAQQITPHEAKTILTRMAEGSKIIMVGDPAQIDNPHVDSRSNGMVYAKNALKDEAFTAHICLTKGERSELAEAAAKKL